MNSKNTRHISPYQGPSEKSHNRRSGMKHEWAIHQQNLKCRQSTCMAHTKDLPLFKRTLPSTSSLQFWPLPSAASTEGGFMLVLPYVSGSVATNWSMTAGWCSLHPDSKRTEISSISKRTEWTFRGSGKLAIFLAMVSANRSLEQYIMKMGKETVGTRLVFPMIIQRSHYDPSSF